jgi:hypothetical protein
MSVDLSSLGRLSTAFSRSAAVGWCIDVWIRGGLCPMSFCDEDEVGSFADEVGAEGVAQDLEHMPRQARKPSS